MEDGVDGGHHLAHAVLPGLDVALRPPPRPDGGRTVADVDRLAANHWELCVGSRQGSARVRVKAQLDVCGAWLTVASDARRPVVVRRAGWVDLRGQPPGSPEPWDRVGLGPGDSLVAVTEAAVDEDALMDVLLPLAGATAEETAAAVTNAFDEPVDAVVLRVPVLTRDQSLQRVADATGLPAEHFAEPLHPVGSPAADLWRSRPAPPREARMRLPPEREAVPAARGLLRRLLASWRMEDLLEGHIELLASELLTNGVLHARTDIVAVVSYDGRAVRFEVHDGSPFLPELEVPDLDDEGGRGLWMVSTLADRWAIDATGRGKRIWFEVAA